MILRFYRRASVGAKLTFIVCVLAALIILTFTLTVTRSAGSLVSTQALARIDDQNRSVATMIGLYDKGLGSEVERFMSLFASFLPPDYTLDEAQKIDINGVPTPMMKAGDKPLNLDFTIPDQFLERSGAIATIFARSGDDFIRVTTSLKKQDGSRAIGTLLDRAGPAYAPVFAGKPYIGLAPLFGKQYITEYKPISDASGRVIGALFVGVDVTREVAVVQQTIADLKLGERGYYFVIDASAGPNRGHFLVHPTASGKPAGEFDPAFTRMLDAHAGALTFTSTDPANGTTHEVDARFVTVPQWQWLVGGVADRDELLAGVTQTRDRFLLIGLGLIGALMLALLLAVKALVSRPLHDVTRASERMAAGDLSVRLHTAREDEIGRLIQAIDGIGAGLARMVAQVREASVVMTSQTEQIAAGSGSIASRIATQASSLEETAASMEQITSTVQQNADNATQADHLVESASQAAVNGGISVERVVATMEEINQSSRKIADITSVIEGIAFQTNILALNAAVEAARAGEHGRGFAVVAAEVRGLAQRSGSAVKEIEALITASNDKVEAGYRIAEQASTTMKSIVESVERVSAIMSEITSASHEQSGGIEQVNIAVMQLGQATQQNADLVAEAERSAQALRNHALDLAQAVDVFKLERG